MFISWWIKKYEPTFNELSLGHEEEQIPVINNNGGGTEDYYVKGKKSGIETWAPCDLAFM